MKSIHKSMLMLLTGTSLMLFSNGRWSMTFAGWIYPLFFLEFMDSRKPFQGLLLLCLATGAANYVMWWKMIPVPGFYYFLITTIFLQIMNLSYLMAKLFATSRRSFSSTLIFPLAYCALEYLLYIGSPKGTWMVMGYSQVPNLRIMQLASLTGVWGVSFLMYWFSSVMHWIWKNHFEWKIVKQGTIVFAAVLILVFVFGFSRLLSQNSNHTKQLTASIVQQRSLNDSISSCRWTDAHAIDRYSDELEENLLGNSEKAAKAGAKIILWQESAGFIPKSSEKLFVEKARLLAAGQKIYLLMALWSIPENFPVHRIENKLLVIDTSGQVEATYIKNFPAAPEPIIRGNGEMPAIHTRFGIIAPAICSDADYPDFIRQSSRNKVSVMFIPANDWRAIDPIHTHMAITRAIENGFSLVRPAGQGLSVATDNRGRVLSSLDYYRSSDQIMYAEIPFGHSWTLYGWAGDYFPIAGMFCLLILILASFLKKKQQISQQITMEGKFSPGM